MLFGRHWQMIRMSRKKQGKNWVFTEAQNILSWKRPTRIIKLPAPGLHRTAPKIISFSKISGKDLYQWKLQCQTKFLSSEKQQKTNPRLCRA